MFVSAGSTGDRRISMYLVSVGRAIESHQIGTYGRRGSHHVPMTSIASSGENRMATPPGFPL